MLSRRLKIAFLVALAAFLYYWAAAVGAHVLSGPQPSWWRPGEGGAISAYSWLQVTHAGGLILVSTPFAIAVAALCSTHPVRLALMVAFLGLVLPSIYFQITTPAWMPAQDTAGVVSAAIDYVKLLTTLPLVTWAASRVLPPNSSFKPKPLRGSA